MIYLMHDHVDGAITADIACCSILDLSLRRIESSQDTDCKMPGQGEWRYPFSRRVIRCFQLVPALLPRFCSALNHRPKFNIYRVIHHLKGGWY